MIFIVREHFFVVGIPQVTPKSDVNPGSLCGAYEREVVKSTQNKRLCQARVFLVAVAMRIFQCTNGQRSTAGSWMEAGRGNDILNDDCSISHWILISLFQEWRHIFSNYAACSRLFHDTALRRPLAGENGVRLTYRNFMSNHFNKNRIPGFHFYIQYRIMTSWYYWTF